MQDAGEATTKANILARFPKEQHHKVFSCMDILMTERIVYKQPRKDCIGKFMGTFHLINFQKFEHSMIDQKLV
jgi:hypothetical protein